MGSEVTMKDLQSLQGFVNKKDADLDKKIADLGKRLDAVDKSISEQTTKYLKELHDMHAAQDKKFVDLHNAQNKNDKTLTDAINALGQRVAKLES